MERIGPVSIAALREQLILDNPKITVEFFCLDCNKLLGRVKMEYRIYNERITNETMPGPKCRNHPASKVYYEGFFPPDAISGRGVIG